MDTFRQRLPGKREVGLVFAACAVPVYSWSMLLYMHKLPSWLMFLSVWELVGTFAYTQVVAFVESVVLAVGLVALGVVLPGRVLRERFVVQGSMLMFVMTGWAVVAQLKLDAIRSMGAGMVGLWMVVMLVTVGVSYELVRRHGRLQGLVRGVVERLTVLLYLYLPLTVGSGVIVLVRNL